MGNFTVKVSSIETNKTLIKPEQYINNILLLTLIQLKCKTKIEKKNN